MDRNIANLLGIDLDDPSEVAETEAISRDMDLVQDLVKARIESGMKQKDVAERMGVSQPTVSDFERLGGDPHLSTIRRYALAVGVSVHHDVVRVSGARALTVTGDGRETAASTAQRAEFTHKPHSVYVAAAK